MKKKQNQRMPIVGAAQEAWYSERKHRVSSIINLTGIDEHISATGNKTITMDMNAEFECPYCAERIRIKIRKKITKDE
jgi:hypothetical protein